MKNIDRTLLAVVIGLLTFSLAVFLVGWRLAFQSDLLLPANKSVIPWHAVAVSDSQVGGSSTIDVGNSYARLDYNFVVAEDSAYPYASMILTFDGPKFIEKIVGISGYHSLSFKAKCAPENYLSLAVDVFDKDVVTAEDQSSYRIFNTFFRCEENLSVVEIDLSRMEIPVWWLRNHSLNGDDNGYELDKVVAFSFGVSPKTPRSVPINVSIEDLVLRKLEYSVVFVITGLVFLVWLAFILWYVKRDLVKRKGLAPHLNKTLDNSMQMMCQKLIVESQSEKERGALLVFMAREYTNPELSLDMVRMQLGISRSKINDILKAEFGVTFSVYLNKLRLSEAAYLLREKEDVSISKIAYSIGYNNVSYFNKLFKIEYGCTPKEYKNINQEDEGDVDMVGQ